MEEQLPLFDETLEEQYNRIQSRIDILIRDVNIFKLEQKKILAQCECKNLIKKESYFEGSYSDKAYTTYWDECTFCKKSYNERIQNHSWYG